MSSFPLTNSIIFQGGWVETTNQILMVHQHFSPQSGPFWCAFFHGFGPGGAGAATWHRAPGRLHLCAGCVAFAGAEFGGILGFDAWDLYGTLGGIQFEWIGGILRGFEKDLSGILMGLDDLNESLMGCISAKSLHEQTGGNLPPWALETYAGPRWPRDPRANSQDLALGLSDYPFRLGRSHEVTVGFSQKIVLVDIPDLSDRFPSPWSSCQRRLRCEIFGSRSPEMTWDLNGI